MRPSPASHAEIQSFLVKHPDWSLQNGKLYREFAFKDFAEAFSFMQKVAAIAEEMDHHPDWSNSYNKVNIALSTHDVGGITQLDLELARRISAVPIRE